MKPVSKTILIILGIMIALLVVLFSWEKTTIHTEMTGDNYSMHKKSRDTETGFF